MPRIVKRYGSRKLYDPTERRYVGLGELAAWIRAGQQVRVIDNRTGEDVTSAVLTQVISDEGRRGTALSVPFLHDLIRAGEEALKGARDEASTFVTRSFDRIRPVAGPLGEVRAEMERLRERLEALEASLRDLDEEAPTNGAASRRPR